MGMIRVFAYGSNLSTRRLRRRTPSAQPVGRASLPAHVLRFHKRGRDGSAKADAFLTGDAADVVHGVLYDVDIAELPVLDRAEGGYGADPLTVLHDHASVAARVYRALPAWIDESIRPFDWYVRYVLEGAREHGLPTAWIRAIERVASIRDPDAARAAANG